MELSLRELSLLYIFQAVFYLKISIQDSLNPRELQSSLPTQVSNALKRQLDAVESSSLSI